MGMRSLKVIERAMLVGAFYGFAAGFVVGFVFKMLLR